MTANLELATALADLVALSETNAITFKDLVVALKQLVSAEGKETIVHVAAPNVTVAAPNVSVAAPAVSVTAQAGPTIVQLVEPTKKKVSLKVHYNDSGRIETMDVITVSEG
jgi:phage baseplate assembly protein gpV